MPTSPALRSLTTHAELLDLTAGDPFVRWGLPDPLTGRVLVGEGAVAIERHGRRGRGLWILPHSGGGEAAVRALLQSLPAHLDDMGTQGISVPQAYADLLAEAFDLGPGGDWDWMWTTSPPPSVAHEDRLVVLNDTTDAQEIAALSTAHSPTGEGDPGSGSTSLWLGLRAASDPQSPRSGRPAAGDELVAVGGMQFLDSGAPHLAGIVTHADHRGQGLGRAVTAGLTRHAIAEHGVCTLGMYSANPPARAVYDGLGYQTAYAWHSRTLAQPHT